MWAAPTLRQRRRPPAQVRSIGFGLFASSLVLPPRPLVNSSFCRHAEARPALFAHSWRQLATLERGPQDALEGGAFASMGENSEGWARALDGTRRDFSLLIKQPQRERGESETRSPGLRSAQRARSGHGAEASQRASRLILLVGGGRA